MHRRAVLAVDALQSKMQACQDEKEFLALLITYENVYSHMNDTTTNSEKLAAFTQTQVDIQLRHEN